MGLRFTRRCADIAEMERMRGTLASAPSAVRPPRGGAGELRHRSLACLPAAVLPALIFAGWVPIVGVISGNALPPAQSGPTKSHPGAIVSSRSPSGALRTIDAVDDRNAQRPAIRRGLGERAKSTLSGPSRSAR